MRETFTRFSSSSKSLQQSNLHLLKDEKKSSHSGGQVKRAVFVEEFIELHETNFAAREFKIFFVTTMKRVILGHLVFACYRLGVIVSE